MTASTQSTDAITPVQQALIEDHLQLATRLARRLRRRGVDNDDLVQVARLALVKAATGYDPSRGSFIPFASTTIRGELKRYFRDHAWVVRPPRRIQDLQAELTAQRDLEPQKVVPEELAESIGADVADVREAMAARGCYTCDSIDAAEAAGHRFGHDEGGFAVVENRMLLKRLWRDLGRDDRRLLRWRFFDELTQQQIADRLGISQMQVSRRLSKLLARLRASAGAVAA